VIVRLKLDWRGVVGSDGSDGSDVTTEGSLLVWATDECTLESENR
jgi:hypothetical protein